MATGSFFSPHAFDIFAKLDDQTVVHDPIDGRRGGQGIFEDLIPLREDGIRTTDSMYQYRVDSLIQNHLQRFEVPYKTLSGTISSRLEQALSWISSYGLLAETENG